MKQIECEVHHFRVSSVLKSRLNIREAASSRFVKNYKFAVHDCAVHSQRFCSSRERRHLCRPVQAFSRKQTDLRNVASPLSNGLYVQLDPVSVEFELMHPVAAIRRRSSFFGELRRNEAGKLFFRSGSQQSLQRCMLFCGSSSSSSFQSRIAALRLEQTLFRTPNMVAALGYLLHR